MADETNLQRESRELAERLARMEQRTVAVEASETTPEWLPSLATERLIQVAYLEDPAETVTAALEDGVFKRKISRFAQTELPTDGSERPVATLVLIGPPVEDEDWPVIGLRNVRSDDGPDVIRAQITCLR